MGTEQRITDAYINGEICVSLPSGRNTDNARTRACKRLGIPHIPIVRHESGKLGIFVERTCVLEGIPLKKLLDKTKGAVK